MNLKFKYILSAGLVLASALAAAWAHGDASEETPYGRAGVASHVSRTVRIDMSDDMRFTPDHISVKKGETVRFVLRNVGQLAHEFSLGTPQELAEHYEVMKKYPNMKHDEPNKVSVEPGQTGEVIWQFTKGGTVDFACLNPGHYDAGMKGQVQVRSR